LVIVGLVAFPSASLAQEVAPEMMVQRTENYTMVLEIGPPEMGTGMMDQGMEANHNVMLRITHADLDMMVMDVTPLIRVTDSVTGVSHDLPQMMGMHDMSSAFHYGQDVFLADGTYVVTVMVGESDAAQFRDVHVMASPMMDEHMDMH
jgi:hypothetical protein